MTKPIPEGIRDALRYDATTGKLFWLKRVSSRRGAGSEAGSMTPRGMIELKYCGQFFQAHRVCWFLHYCEQPPENIDHKDGDPSNNAIRNLRAATKSQNNANRRRSGRWLKGVQRIRDGYQAQITFGGTTHYLGYFRSEEEAHAAYVAKAVEIFGEFARAA